MHSLTFSVSALVRHVQQGREPGEYRLAVVARGLRQLHHVHRDGHRGLVGHQRLPGVVGDHAAHRGHHDRPVSGSPAASDLYCVVSSTCRYHSRPPRTTSMARATTYRPSSRLRERGITGPPPPSAAAAGGACATGDGRAAATRPTATRCTSCAACADAASAGTSAPRPPTPEPMTVRGRLAPPSQPLRGERAAAGKTPDAAEPEPRSQPRDGERRRASGVPAPDSADRPDGADRAARASPADRAGRAATGELAACAVPPEPVREPARARGRAPAAERPPASPAAAGRRASPGTGSAPLASRRGTAGDAGDLSQFLPGVARSPGRAARAAGEARSRREVQPRGPAAGQGATGRRESRPLSF